VKPMKIFVDAHVFDGKYQGTTTYIKGLYSALALNPDFDITLAANNIENLQREFPNPNFRFIKFPSHSKIKRLAWDIPQLIKKGKYDYAHFQYITPLQKKCTYINTIHDLLFLDFPKYFPLKYRISKALTFGFSAFRSDIICTVSNYSKLSLINHFKIKDTKIVITPNAVEPFKNITTNISDKIGTRKFILYVSRVEPRKNHISLLKAFVELKLYEQDYNLIFIGKANDVEANEYVSYWTNLPTNISQHVLHFEDISTDELQSFYQKASLFVYPSFAEGFGIPPLEAGIANCKVICSNQTAMNDFTFFNQYSFNPNNVEELKAKIVTLLSTTEEYPYEIIHKAIVDKYNWETIAQEFGEILKKQKGRPS
jgi:glycosyltransferase involved in cell wall biosynthesis